MIHTLTKLLDRLGTQDVARTNAAQAAIRLMHGRRQRDDINDYLTQRLNTDTFNSGQPSDSDLVPIKDNTTSRPQH